MPILCRKNAEKATGKTGRGKRIGMARLRVCSSRRASIRMNRPVASAAAIPERLAEDDSTAERHWCTARFPDVSFRGAKRRGNLAVLGRIIGHFRRKRNCLPEIATGAKRPRNDKSGGLAPQNRYGVHSSFFSFQYSLFIK